MRKTLEYIWQLPQNLLGLLLLAVYAGTDNDYEGTKVRRSQKMRGGISLGRYIIVGTYASHTTIRHEFGRCKQSRILGPLYLFLIGAPSLLHAWLCPCKTHSYYDFFTEKWADRLGGVNR